MDHPFDSAIALEASGPGRYRGRAPDAYWNMAGPFGGTTAAALLRAALLDQADGVEPVALTVNYCAALVQGEFQIGVRELRSGKSVRHVSLELTQGDAVAASASVVLALRRATWSHQVAAMPDVPPPDALTPMDTSGRLPWLQRYEFRFVRGSLQPQAQPFAQAQSP